MKNDKNPKPFYKTWWFILLFIIFSFPIWPFILGYFLISKIIKSRLNKKLKYLVAILVLLPIIFFGSGWTYGFFHPTPPKDIKTKKILIPTITPSATLRPSNTPTRSIKISITQAPSVSQRPSNTLTKSIKSSPTQIPSFTNRMIVRVKRVIDGDTIELESGQKVRYIGIDTPETVHPSKPIECFGKEASAKNKELVEGKTIELEKDVSEIDKYGRLLRYIWVNNVLINEVLVREGYAQSSTYPPDVKYQERILEAQKLAREENKGLWSTCDYFGQPLTTSPLTTSQTTIQVPQTTTSTEGCIIKGNISSSGEKIYHLPGCASYNQTIIDESKGEKWFCSETDAVNGGWRKAKNCP